MHRKKSTWLILTAILLTIATITTLIIVFSNRPQMEEETMTIDYIEGDWGRNEIKSFLADQESLIIKFKDEPNGSDYTFNGTPQEMANLYIGYDSFEQKYDNATNQMWSRYRLSVVENIQKAIQSANPHINKLKENATNQGVLPAAIDNNYGLYHIQFTTSDETWKNTMNQLTNKTGSSTLLLPVNISLESIQCYGLVEVHVESETYTFDIYFGEKCLTEIITDNMKIEILSLDGSEKYATVSTGAYFKPTNIENAFSYIYGYYN